MLAALELSTKPPPMGMFFEFNVAAGVIVGERLTVFRRFYNEVIVTGNSHCGASSVIPLVLVSKISLSCKSISWNKVCKDNHLRQIVRANTNSVWLERSLRFVRRAHVPLFD